jgi:hypothetical protein
VTRWKAISLLVLSLTLLLTACPSSEKSEGEADVAAFVENLLEDETPSEESSPSEESPPSEDSTSSEDVSDLIVETPSDDGDDLSLEDDNSFPEDRAWEESWHSVDGCENLPDGVDPSVVPKAAQAAVNASGDAELEVALCEPVNPEIPFSHLYSGYFHCLNWLDFGSEHHAGAGATLGMVEAAYGMPHGTLYYILRLPSDPWPSEIICEYGSVNESGDAFYSGSVNLQWQGPGPPGPPVPLPESHSVPADATTLFP